MRRIIFWLMIVVMVISAVLLLYGTARLLFTSLTGAVDYKYFWYMLAFITLIISSGIIESMIRPMD